MDRRPKKPMPELMPANGQFGNDYFPVMSTKGAVVRARFLKDNIGENYVIDPTTSKPYVVPQNYDPNKTIEDFSNRMKELVNPLPDAMALGDNIEAIFPYLYDAYQRGGRNDLQRPLPDKTDVVTEFVPGGSFDYGLATATLGIPTEPAVAAGGAYYLFTHPAIPTNYEMLRDDITNLPNYLTNFRNNPPDWAKDKDRYFRNLLNEPADWGNNPSNAANTRDGAYHFNQGTFRQFGGPMP